MPTPTLVLAVVDGRPSNLSPDGLRLRKIVIAGYLEFGHDPNSASSQVREYGGTAAL
jgi:hypothetical protein